METYLTIRATSNLTSKIWLVWTSLPLNSRTSLPVARSHTLIDLSQLALTRRPLRGSNDNARTSASCPVKSRRHSPVVALQILILQSWDPDTMRSPYLRISHKVGSRTSTTDFVLNAGQPSVVTFKGSQAFSTFDIPEDKFSISAGTHLQVHKKRNQCIQKRIYHTTRPC